MIPRTRFPMKKKLVIAGTVGMLCFLAYGLAIVTGGERLSTKARKEWKEKAIAEISQVTSDNARLLKEIETLKTNSSEESEWDRWISKDLILMTNGEWVVCRNIRAKEQGQIPDLFLGRGSDGRWYYSTYHFCVGMIVLKTVTGQPENLAKFKQDCYLCEFDGRSDECLKKTWPPKH
jgi:hypothetical protein